MVSDEQRSKKHMRNPNKHHALTHVETCSSASIREGPGKKSISRMRRPKPQVLRTETVISVAKLNPLAASPAWKATLRTSAAERMSWRDLPGTSPIHAKEVSGNPSRRLIEALYSPFSLLKMESMDRTGKS